MVKKELISRVDMTKYSEATLSLTLEEKVGQLFMPAAFINDGEGEIQKLEKLIKEFGIGGICFFHSRASAATNYEGKKEVLYNKESLSLLKKLIKRYQKASKFPLLISIDAEWGLAMRIENTPQYPYCLTLGALDGHNNLIFEQGRHIGHDCRETGIHWNFAPVSDINSNPNNPVISYRSFGSNKAKVAEKAVAMSTGLAEGGVLNSAKHFPGHGDTATDSHLGLPCIEKSKDELWDNELLPFRVLIEQGIDSIMVGHLSVPSLAKGSTQPSSLSKDIIKGLLRGELGFKGTVVSDALNMHAVSKLYPTKGELEWLAFDAGNDVLCFAENVKEGIAMILNKAIDSQIEESFRRVWYLKEKALAFQTKNFREKLSIPEKLNRQIALQAITYLGDDETDLERFWTADTLGLTAGNKEVSRFLEKCKEEKELPSYSLFDISHPMEKDKLERAEKIVFTIFPPSVKPQNNFGFSFEEMEIIKDILATKEVVLYLFGNPYFLNLLGSIEIKHKVLVYQDFEVFQEVAAEHFFGKFKANGSVPITLDL